MHRGAGLDVLIVSLGSTPGLRRADEQLRDSIARAGASAAIARADAPPQVRTLALTDLLWARAARAAAARALAEREGGVRAVLYSSTTAALLWPRAGAIRFDATAAGNRPGRHGCWQRPLERHRLAQAPLLLPWSAGALREAPAVARGDSRALVLPAAVQPARPGPDARAAPRDVAALTYAANPHKKGLDRVLAAWQALRGERERVGEELLVTGLDADALQAFAGERALEGVRTLGSLASEDFRALLRRARAFVCAPRREDYGLAQLEALAEGCQLVTTPAPGPYAALPLARALDPRLVDGQLQQGLRAALDDPLPGYAERARQALEPFSQAEADRVVREQLLPRLLSS
jgi:glycosyltransferase involved in cell wall biosynthesis